MEPGTRPTHWPPRLGDYVRLRNDEALGEVIEITGQPPDCQYVLNILVRRRVDPCESPLDDLIPVWPDRPEAEASSWPDLSYATDEQAEEPLRGAMQPRDIDLLRYMMTRAGWPDHGAGRHI